MRKTYFLALLLTACFSASIFSADNPVPNAPSIVYVEKSGRRLFIQDRLSNGSLADPRAYVMRGVNWSPTSQGTNPAANPTVFQQEFINWYQADIQQMVAMGVNTIRVYHDFGTGPQAFQILDEFYRHGIKVIMQVDSPRHGVVASTANISTVVNAYKNHPAILMWAVGNEWDLKLFNKYYFTFDTIQQAARFVEQGAQLVKSIDPNHPVTTLTIDPHAPGLHPLSIEMFPYQLPPYVSAIVISMSEIVNQLVPSVDVWGLNVYRGDNLQDVFQMWRSISTKPIFIGEFGADVYDHRVNSENQNMQEQVDTGIWDEIFFDFSAERLNGAAIGGLVFEWNDEWWKNGLPATHNVSSESNGGQPDGVNDEEWFGIVTISRAPRNAYLGLQSRFLNGQASVALNSHPTIRAISNGDKNQQSFIGTTFQIGTKTVFSRGGLQYGARGINVAILDPYTGIRMQEIKSFDTWQDSSKFADLDSYLNNLPNGTIILLAIGDEGGFIAGAVITNPNQVPRSSPYIEQGYRALEALGSTQIRNVKYWGSWAMIAVKGQGKIAEAMNNLMNDPYMRVPAIAEAQVSLNLNPDAGRRDNIPPQIVIVGSISQYTNQSTLVVNYLVDGTPKQASFDLQEGINQRSIVEVDGAGNQTTYSFSVTLDTVVPSGSIAINGNDPSTPSRDVALTLTASDSGAGVDKISFSTDGGVNWTPWENFVSVKSFTLPQGNGQKEVRYRVRDLAGNIALFSDTILLQVLPEVPPAKPSNLKAATVSSGSISLNWNDNSNNETGFKIERKNGSGSFAQIATTGSNTTRFLNSGLMPNTVYYYRARAYNLAGDSDYSNSGIAMTPSAVSRPWQNSRNPFDVNNNGVITPIDALLIINRLISGGGGLLTGSPGNPPTYYDVNGNGSLTPIDARLVINYLIGINT